jgi:hypothetical protein
LGEEVNREMHRYKTGTAKSGKGGKGSRMKSRKQAIAVAPGRRVRCKHAEQINLRNDFATPS